MKLRFAFAGFRHGHIYDLYTRAQNSPETEVVAACEEDAAAREQLAGQGKVALTHDDYRRMLDQVECDVVACGDYYGKRGSLLIEALRRGKHVIGDKPLCTGLAELDEIARLAAAGSRKVGCMLDLRDNARFIGTRALIQQGVVGAVHAVAFGGQHPLLLGSRPAWYFEPGKHGGTINDIGIHAIDALPWITGLSIVRVNAARCWNAFAPKFPHFHDAGQLMLTMSNGCGVLGDVSYFMPNSSGYGLPFYWRMTFFGTKGVLETSTGEKGISLALDGEPGLVARAHPEAQPGGYFAAFLNDIAGRPQPGALTTETALASARRTLLIQHAADLGECNVDL